MDFRPVSSCYLHHKKVLPQGAAPQLRLTLCNPTCPLTVNKIDLTIFQTSLYQGLTEQLSKKYTELSVHLIKYQNITTCIIFVLMLCSPTQPSGRIFILFFSRLKSVNEHIASQYSTKSNLFNVEMIHVWVYAAH